MVYRYEFDGTRVGDLRLDRVDYEVYQESLRSLRDEIRAWNEKALSYGAESAPYGEEVANLNQMIEWADRRLAHSDATAIWVDGVSVGSLRYIKAALLLNIRRREKDRDQRAQEEVPDAVLRSIDAGINPIRRLAQDIDLPPAEVLWQVMPREEDETHTVQQTMEWDVFISHASEDKEEFVRPLVNALQARGLSVWFDEFTLKVGDSLRRSIDQGLAHSEFGIVVISRNFLQKEWPQRELDGLVAREIEGVKVILPVWHNITTDEVREYSPTLADRVATISGAGMEKVVADLMRAMGKNSPAPGTNKPAG